MSPPDIQLPDDGDPCTDEDDGVGTVDPPCIQEDDEEKSNASTTPPEPNSGREPCYTRGEDPEKDRLIDQLLSLIGSQITGPEIGIDLGENADLGPEIPQFFMCLSKQALRNIIDGYGNPSDPFNIDGKNCTGLLCQLYPQFPPNFQGRGPNDLFNNYPPWKPYPPGTDPKIGDVFRAGDNHTGINLGNLPNGLRVVLERNGNNDNMVGITVLTEDGKYPDQSQRRREYDRPPTPIIWYPSPGLPPGAK
jgi:hypothetical protein